MGKLKNTHVRKTRSTGIPSSGIASENKLTKGKPRFRQRACEQVILFDLILWLAKWIKPKSVRNMKAIKGHARAEYPACLTHNSTWPWPELGFFQDFKHRMVCLLNQGWILSTFQTLPPKQPGAKWHPFQRFERKPADRTGGCFSRLLQYLDVEPSSKWVRLPLAKRLRRRTLPNRAPLRKLRRPSLAKTSHGNISHRASV